MTKYYCLLSIIITALFSLNAYAEPLITRNSRIKQDGDRVYAVVPFPQWYLDKYDLTKDDFRNLNYPYKTKYGEAKAFMKHKWGAEKGDKRVKLSISYTETPSYDVLKIKDAEIIIKYVSDEEFLNSSE